MVRQALEDFRTAIDFAIADDEPALFLRAWREGDWQTLREEWPEFKLPPMADIPAPAAFLWIHKPHSLGPTEAAAARAFFESASADGYRPPYGQHNIASDAIRNVIGDEVGSWAIDLQGEGRTDKTGEQ